MKTHIMRLAVQDLSGSTIRKRALRLGRRELWLLYQDLLWRLHESGGYLPSDPAALVDEVDFFTAEEIAALLPLLEPAPGKQGGIVVEKKLGRIYNQRVLDELSDEKAFIQEQAARGKRGGRARARAIREAAAIDKDSSGQATAKRRPRKLKPSVAVSVAAAVAVSSSSSTTDTVKEPPATPSALAVREKPWSSEAVDDWRAGTGGEPRGSDDASGGRIGKALKPLVERVARDKALDFGDAWKLMRPWWRKFCDSDNSRFGPEYFASNPRAALGIGASKPAEKGLGAMLEALEGE